MFFDSVNGPQGCKFDTFFNSNNGQILKEGCFEAFRKDAHFTVWNNHTGRHISMDLALKFISDWTSFYN